MKEEGIPASFVTAYDYPSAVFSDQAGIDMLLIGDSGGMTMLGYKNTMPVTMDEMLHFTGAVCRGNQNCFVIGDMPFMSYQVCDQDAIYNAGRFMALGCDAVKVENCIHMYDRIQAISGAGIPVMAHLGLTPQRLSQMGGYRVTGKNEKEIDELIEDAGAAEAAGADFILLEAMPENVASRIRDFVGIPAYGIGAGRKVDGQLLILHDLIGSFVGDVKPKFVKQYAEVGKIIRESLMAYDQDVKSGMFPGEEHLYSC